MKFKISLPLNYQQSVSIDTYKISVIVIIRIDDGAVFKIGTRHFCLKVSLDLFWSSIIASKFGPNITLKNVAEALFGTSPSGDANVPLQLSHVVFDFIEFLQKTKTIGSTVMTSKGFSSLFGYGADWTGLAMIAGAIPFPSIRKGIRSRFSRLDLQELLI
jgi:hypothetical protein